MTANTPLRPAAKQEPFAGPPRCGGELVAGRLSGWYIRRVRQPANTRFQTGPSVAAGALPAEGTPRS